MEAEAVDFFALLLPQKKTASTASASTSLLMILAVSLYLLLLLPLSTPSGLFNVMLGVSEPGALNCYTFFRLIPLTSFVSRNPKAVNRITHNLQLVSTRFHYYFYCIHGTPLHIRNQYTEIGIITSNKRRTLAVPPRNP